MSKAVLWLCLVLLLAGCQAHPVPTSVAVPPIQVDLDPALGWLSPSMADCAIQASVSINVREADPAAQSLEDADIVMSWNDEAAASGNIFEIGQDRLAVVINPDNLASEITSMQLVEIYSGAVSDWANIDSGYNGSIQPWVYDRSNGIQRYFNRIVLPQEEISRFSRIVPDPAAMIEAISKDPNAIGIVPARWLDSSVKELVIADLAIEEWTLPILAVSTTDPTGALRDWLLCVQDAVQQ